MTLQEYDNGNVFARMTDVGTRPTSTHVVYEDANVLAFLDAHPNVPGDTLVIPKITGYPDLFSLPAEVSAELGRVLPSIANALKATQHCDGVNILMNVGSAAGQEIPHPHWHVLCQKEGAEPIIHHPEKKEFDDGMLAGVAKQIKAAIHSGSFSCFGKG